MSVTDFCTLEAYVDLCWLTINQANIIYSFKLFKQDVNTVLSPNQRLNQKNNNLIGGLAHQNNYALKQGGKKH